MLWNVSVINISMTDGFNLLLDIYYSWIMLIVFIYTCNSTQRPFFIFVFLRMKNHQINPVSLRFVDTELEEHYSIEKEKRSGAAFCCCMIVLFFITAMEVFIDPTWVRSGPTDGKGGPGVNVSLFPLRSRLVVNYVTLAAGEVLLLILTVCSLAAIFPRVRRKK